MLRFKYEQQPFAYTRDLRVVDRFMKYPAIKKILPDDVRNAKQLIKGAIDHHILVFNKGLLIFSTEDGNFWESSIYFLPEKRGIYAYQAAETALRFMRDSIGAKTLAATVAENNKASLKFVRFFGFKKFGEKPNTFPQKGKLYTKHQFLKEL